MGTPGSVVHCPSRLKSNLQMASSMLQATPDGKIIVIDLPQSITEVQGRHDGAHLSSCVPLVRPYSTRDPSTQKQSDQVLRHEEPSERVLDLEKCQRLRSSLQHIGLNFPSLSYCLPRPVTTTPVRKGKPRAFAKHMSTNGVEDEEQPSAEEELPDNLLLELGSNAAGAYIKQDVRMELVYAYPNEFRNASVDSVEPANNHTHSVFKDFVHNTSDMPKELVLKVPDNTRGSRTHRFHLPPQSAYLLTNSKDTASFRAATREYSPDLRPSRGRFDLVVLDPPWPNRSAQRKQSYQESKNMTSIEDILYGLDLDMHIAPNGCVAIWVTNRSAFRELMLGEGGLFETWNVSLAEEWTWLKVTSKGEPVMPLQSHWRKPYETLLIGRSPENRSIPGQKLSPEEVVHRTLIGVPDIHSRKPCLKSVFESTILQSAGPAYVGLEIFARHLVSGWMSWGDQAIKYNWEGFWKKEHCTSL